MKKTTFIILATVLVAILGTSLGAADCVCERCECTAVTDCVEKIKPFRVICEGVSSGASLPEDEDLNFFHTATLTEKATEVRDHVSRKAQGNVEVLAMYDTLVADLRTAPPEIDTAQILDAVAFSAMKHEGQERKGPSHLPYIIHPIGVAHTIWAIGDERDQNTLIAALLHDTLEDTETKAEEIEALFGAHVRSIVEEVTDNKELPKAMRKQLQIQNAPHKSREAKLVKLADKLYNLRDMMAGRPVTWDAERVNEYFGWGEKVVAGLRGTNTAIEAELDKVFAEHHRSEIAAK